MCAVIGVHNNDKVDIDSFRKLLDQSMIRGKHATGLAYIDYKDANKIKHFILPKSADAFDIPDNIYTKMLIAHCRYSTSDIEWNQPIVSQDIAVVHNGVITQSDPSTWEATYNYKFETKCDSEIILRAWENQSHALWLEGSMSAVVIDARGTNSMHFFRNEQRPLYYAQANKDTFIASTKDILERAGISGFGIEKTEPCVDYVIQKNALRKARIRDVIEDLQ